MLEWAKENAMATEKKLRLKPSREGQRLNGKQLFAADLTHDQCQELCNSGNVSWFMWCDAAEHPCQSERPKVEQPKVEQPKKPGQERLVIPKEEPAA